MLRDCKIVWENCLKVIKQYVGEQSYKTWFEPIVPQRLEHNVLTIQVPSQFFYEWLEEHYVHILKRAIDAELGASGKLEYSIIVDKGAKQEQPLYVNLPTNNIPQGSNLHVNQNFVDEPLPSFKTNPLTGDNGFESYLNPRYTFDCFVEGDCNRLARSAGMAVANKPGTTAFNPLMIYSTVGLGKSHLVQAIGNKLSYENKESVVIYISCEKFANQVVEAFKNNRIQDFIQKYQKVDVLIVDDIQFLSGKVKTQEIFFYIFNHLHQSGKQIIMTSDCPPKELKGVEERLISRFKWGLTADLSAPDQDTRREIIVSKMEHDGVQVLEEVVDYLAYNIETNIRELEGVLISLIAQSSLTRKEIDMELARKVVHSIVQNSEVELNIEYIQKYVANYFDVTIDQMKSKTRKREIVVPRQVAMYLTKEYTNMSLKSIGYHFGNRDHSTIIHAIKAVNDMMDTDQHFYATMQELLKKVKMKAS